LTGGANREALARTGKTAVSKNSATKISRGIRRFTLTDTELRRDLTPQKDTNLFLAIESLLTMRTIRNLEGKPFF
jgi:hypothetical protein